MANQIFDGTTTANLQRMAKRNRNCYYKEVWREGQTLHDGNHALDNIY